IEQRRGFGVAPQLRERQGLAMLGRHAATGAVPRKCLIVGPLRIGFGVIGALLVALHRGRGGGKHARRDYKTGGCRDNRKPAHGLKEPSCMAKARYHLLRLRGSREDSMARYLPALCAALLVLVFSLTTVNSAFAQNGPAAAPTSTVDVKPLPPAGMPVAFDPDKATNAYLAQVSGEARQKSDSYFEGGYWL